jgi:acetylornithine deacetylase
VPADALGPPLLIGPGSIHTAHTDHEHVSIDELQQAVTLYEGLAMRLLTTGE